MKPQFSLRTLLGLTAVSALWCASFTMNEAMDTVQGTIKLMLFVGAAAGAIHYRGCWQAFWMGFLFVFLVSTCPPIGSFFGKCYPEFQSTSRVDGYFGDSLFAERTLDLVGKVAICCLGGYVSFSIFADGQGDAAKSRLGRRMVLGLMVIGAFAYLTIGAAQNDLQQIIKLMLLVAAIASAIRYRGNRQAFWMGFLFVYLVFVCPDISDFFVNCYPRLESIQRVRAYFGTALERALKFIATIAICCLGGSISSSIFKHAHRPHQAQQ